MHHGDMKSHFTRFPVFIFDIKHSIVDLALLIFAAPRKIACKLLGETAVFNQEHVSGKYAVIVLKGIAGSDFAAWNYSNVAGNYNTDIPVWRGPDILGSDLYLGEGGKTGDFQEEPPLPDVPPMEDDVPF